MIKDTQIKTYIARLLSLESDSEDIDELWAELKLLDWDTLIEIARENRVMLLVSYKMRQLGLEERLGPRIRQTLYLKYQKGIARNVIYKRVLKEVIRSLNKNQVKAILLKGATMFCENIYQNQYIRSMADLDIHILKEDFPVARKCLMKAGLHYKGGRVPADLHEDFWGKGAKVELHYLPVPEKYRTVFNMELFWENAVDAEIDGIKTYIPSPTDQIYHSFIHTMVRHQYLIKYQIHDLYDFVMIVQYYREMIEWEEILKRVNANNIESLFKFYCWQITRNFGFCLPDPINNLRVEETVRYEILYNRLKDCPGWLESASERLMAILIKGDNVTSHIKNTYKVIIKESLLDESKEFLVSLYNLEGKRFLLPFIRVVHFFRITSLHILIVVYFAKR
ncbi:MAG: hypothetical protein D8M57_08540 [Candidatus Scalindua sp. AMX11]|nr:nucleotidyltransferase family protein [Planctomycetota bacterium]RZV65759.1 MAG: hypothetical protein EX341_17805 [Candidatus Scalindua sp. SCAELEC01]TDE65391.1 MAG: hypothetical protein D8M57_08540 [Candidatus Scalindua sp. AMX11]GJQ60340.1 MAG: hypothetical protein SCALA701_31410 [Candidatus Scalindua sp.]